jgi:single-stranded DNA-specific DHH superfamily exonuclease
MYINDINYDNYELIESFSPFGESWPVPKFRLPHIKVSSLMYSRDAQHILTSIGNSARLTCFYFSKEKMNEYQYVDMIGTLRTSTYYNKTTVEFLINEITNSK